MIIEYKRLIKFDYCARDRWIASRISEILGSEDDVVIELCYNLIESSRFVSFWRSPLIKRNPTPATMTNLKPLFSLTSKAYRSSSPGS